MGQGQEDSGNGGQSQLYMTLIAGGYTCRIVERLRSIFWPL